MTIFLLCMRPFLYPIPLSEFKSVHLGIYKIGFYRSQVYSYYKKNSHFSCSSLSSSFSPLPPDLGHRGSRAVSEFGRGFLPWCGLLRTLLRRHHADHLQVPRQLEGRIPHPGFTQRPRKLSLRCLGKQNRLGK